MKCPEAELTMIDFLAGPQSAEIPDALLQHLNSCNSCSKLMNEYRKGFSLLKETRKSEPDPDFYNSVVFRMNEVPENSTHFNPVKKILHFSPAVLAAAASVILGIWLGGRLVSSTISADTGKSISLSDYKTGLLELYSGELNPEDETSRMLESYLSENMKSELNGNE